MPASIEYYGEHCKSGVPVEDRRAFLASALARGYPLVSKTESNWRPLAIVGGGPSVRDDLDDLRNWKSRGRYAEIWAANNCLSWLMDNGVNVDGFVACDSDEMIAGYISRAPDITYYLSTTCHPKAFDAVNGRSVMAWHAGVNDLDYPAGQGVVGGGPTIMSRAPMLAFCLGYRDVHLFGADSSYNEGIHVYEGSPGAGAIFKVRLDDKIYHTQAEFLHQAAYFQAIWDYYHERGARFEVHGRGLGPDLLKAKMHDPDKLLDAVERAVA